MSLNRIEAEHIAFEEAARLVKEYRRKYRRMVVVSWFLTFALLLTIGALLWMTDLF